MSGKNVQRLSCSNHQVLYTVGKDFSSWTTFLLTIFPKNQANKSYDLSKSQNNDVIKIGKFQGCQYIKYYIPLERFFCAEQLFCLQFFLKIKPIKVMTFKNLEIMTSSKLENSNDGNTVLYIPLENFFLVLINIFGYKKRSK